MGTVVPTVKAHEFAGLVGKYVRMERPAEEVEALEHRASTGNDLDTVGFEGLVAMVRDTTPRVGGWGVEIITDYGMGFLVVQDDLAEWTIAIWPDEETCREMRL